MDNRKFRDAMGRFATGITVVTTEYENEYIGMTVNAFMSVSLEPKLIAVSIDEKASLYEKLQETKTFGVSFLKEDQKDLSMVFARQKESEREIEFIKQDHIPVLKDALATISCRVKDTFKAGDHLIFIGEVTELSIHEGKPLLYYGGDYRSINLD